MNPFFFLQVKKGKDYHIFNPVDNTEYTLNYKAYRILEQCDGMHSVDEIADSVDGNFKNRAEAIDYITVFLDEMCRLGMIAWRQEKFEISKKWYPPSSVFWDITRNCNLKCLHCYNFHEYDHNEELSADEAKRVLEEMSIFGVESISFSGGDPLMRKDFLEIVRHAAGLNFKSVGVATNGTLIDRDIARQLKLPNTHVQISIDGDVAEIHDSMRGVKGSFDKAVNGIKLLIEEGVNTSVCTTATRLNVDRVPNIIQLMKDLCVENYRVQGMVPIGRGKMSEKELKLAPDRMKKLVEYLENEGIHITSYNFTLKPPPTEPVDFCGSGACSAASTSCSITPEGNVVPCTYFWGLNGENLRDHTFQWIWENSALLNYYRSISLNEIKGICRECKWLSLCHGGCKAENYLNGDIFASSRSCWVADETMRMQ